MQGGRETIAIALESIRANLLRASLTMLGIVIGVAAVITMVAVGSGAQRAIEEQIASLGAELLSVYSGQRYSRGIASSDGVSLTSDDAAALARETAWFADTLPEIESSLPVRFGRENIFVSVLGTTANFPELRGYALAHGRMFTRGDGPARRRYAVLGSLVPDLLAARPESLVGSTLFIQGIPFEVIGIFAEKGSEGYGNPDERITIPLETAQLRLLGSDRLRAISVKAAPGVPMPQAMVEVERVLRREHRLRPGTPNDFRILNRQDVLETRQQATQVFTVLLASIAAVSLVVGGIGIMNIMLVSVTERTREIGIRKALGATRGDILRQFLVEAVVLCLLGGAAGIGLGWMGAAVLARLAGFATAVTPEAVFVAFAFSAAVGIVFGILPARRAAALNPVDALRYE
jgi:putative ABC transport system permease protein